MKSQLAFILISLSLLSVMFGLSWLYCFYKKTFAWLDFVWSLSFVVVIALYQIYYFQAYGETSLRPIDLIYIFWALRLSSYLYFRIKKHGEDKRYVELKKKWKVWYGLNFFLLFQLEAVLTIILSVPLLLSYGEKFTPLNLISLGLFFVAILGESISDKQLANFIKANKDSTKVCNVGFWKYSRHPNYFFEWMIWVSFGLYGLTSMEKWPAFIPAVVMYFMLTKVTGIPPAEASSLKSKGEIYKSYQNRTNAFFPWKSKTSSIILLAALSFFSTASNVLGAPMTQAERIQEIFNELRADNLSILDNFYHQKTVFIDPLGKHEGREKVKDYYKNLYRNVKDIDFKFHDVVSSGNIHAAYWTMTLRANGLNGGEEIKVDGNSLIKFDESNLVIYHRDYFDMGEFIYEQIPVLGWTIKQIKNKMRETK